MQIQDNIFEDDRSDIDYVVHVVSKEAPKDKKLITQVLTTMLSAKSNEPINLAVNAPTGQGKTYVVQKVADLFPKSDVICLVGMSEKALFHRSGKLVIKDETGNYVAIEQKIQEIDLQIQEIKNDIDSTSNKDLKQAKPHEIKELEDQKKEIYKKSKKLIELGGMTLIFLDSPNAALLEALIPLLSHDRNEVEYEFVDTYNGIKTQGNVLRGFPAVILTAAKDYTNNQRYSEIQRRFLITNPEMSSEKYHEAIHCISAKYSLPDFAYQHVVVSDEEKERARSIISNIQEQITEICQSPTESKRDHNQVLIPYYKALEKSLPYSNASYMSAAKTLFALISLSAIIHGSQRPMIRAFTNDYLIQKIPLATFDDLKEAMSLIEYNNGVRPYILKWYQEVFIPAYESKREPDSKEGRNGQLLSENRIAVTTRDLIKKTEEIQNSKMSSKQIHEYVDPLENLNIISSEPSVLDGRAKIYYPVKSVNENKNIFDLSNSNNISQYLNIRVENPTLFPDKNCIINEVRQIMRYSSDTRNKLLDHNEVERSIEEIAHQYYTNVSECFSPHNMDIMIATHQNSLNYDFIITDHISREYHYDHQNANKLQENSQYNI